ncbi:MAG: polyisoprenoid-binding protein [Ottowia sp.]|nr:polyisoprenoid-binding protein [Ottowia sp.]
MACAAVETYQLDPHHTFSSFEYSHLGYSTQRSRFNKTTGKITLDPVNHSGSADITIDVESIDTGSKIFDQHLHGEDFFDARKFPTITFKSNQFKFNGDVLSEINGEMTSKGVTKPVTLKVTQFKCMMHPMMKKEACGANAVATISRTEFNNGKYAPHVSDTVTLHIAIEAVKQD